MRGEYLDLQCNGYGGVDYNSDGLTAEDLHRSCEKIRSDGGGQILATIITDHVDRMVSRIRAVAEHRERDPLVKEVIAGFHIEGPFISGTTGFRGAHPADAVIPADVESTKRLHEACGGLLRLLTLAPEHDMDFATTRWLAKNKVVVSAGHTGASLDQLKGACDAGLSMFTHLGNGCPMVGMNRHDNIIQRALYLREKLWLCFIADFAHVTWFALQNYLDLAGDRAVVVTDAVAPAGLGKGKFKLGRWDLVIGDDLVARAPDGSHLIGAVITMDQSRANLQERLGLSEARCRQLLVENPRRAIGAAL